MASHKISPFTEHLVVVSHESLDQNRLQSDRAYEALRSEIIRCRLTPGGRFSEAELTARFGFGKAAIRTSLLRLCQEGLAQAIPRHGYVVTPITVKDVLDVFEIRSILEPAAARLATGKVSEEELMHADARWRTGETEVQDETKELSLRANKEFHLIIARATGNARLIQAEARVLDETDRLVYLGLPLASERAEIREGHKALLEALVRGTPRAAEDAALKHVEAAKAIVLDAIVSFPSILSAQISAERRTGSGRQ